MMDAFHTKRFESVSGAAEQPSGGVLIISRKSLIKRELALILVRGLVGGADSVAEEEDAIDDGNLQML
jgi:hypothetical protein